MKPRHPHEAIGYTRKSERKTRLTRRERAAEPGK
jgi:hypothetical protein